MGYEGALEEGGRNCKGEGYELFDGSIRVPSLAFLYEFGEKRCEGLFRDIRLLDRIPLKDPPILANSPYGSIKVRVVDSLKMGNQIS